MLQIHEKVSAKQAENNISMIKMLLTVDTSSGSMNMMSREKYHAISTAKVTRTL